MRGGRSSDADTREACTSSDGKNASDEHTAKVRPFSPSTGIGV